MVKKIFFDGIDLHPFHTEVIRSKPINGFEYLEISREYPFTLLNKRICVPYPLYPFLNFPFYPKKFLKENKIDLIHSFRAFPLNSFPWVTDVEHFLYLNGSCFYFNDGLLGSWIKSFALKLVKKRLYSKHCKKILPWSNYAFETIKKHTDFKKLKHKTQTIFGAINLRKPVFNKKFKEKEKVLIGFVASNSFYSKGGQFVLNAFKKLSKKIDVELIVFGRVSNEIVKANKNVSFKKLPREEFISKHLPKIDFLVLPSLLESFGMSCLEAMQFSIPLITSNVMALPEINEHGKTGLIVEYPLKFIQELDKRPWAWRKNLYLINRKEFENQLFEAMQLLAEDFALRKTLGRNARKSVVSGKFSMKKRKENLKTVWEEAIKA
jgi:glycosyltransferase involved in cell wall biosynthesis